MQKNAKKLRCEAFQLTKVILPRRNEPTCEVIGSANTT